MVATFATRVVCTELSFFLRFQWDHHLGLRVAKKPPVTKQVNHGKSSLLIMANYG